MTNATRYITKWLAEDEPAEDTKIAISARIPRDMNAKLERLAAEFGINKTEALIASIDVGVDAVLAEWESSQRGVKRPEPPMSKGKFALLNPTQHGFQLEQAYDAYLDVVQDEYDLKMQAYDAMMENK